MLNTVSTFKPRKATSLTAEELSALGEALPGLAPGEAVEISREPRDSEGKARTDALAVRKQWYTHSGGMELRTHVLETTDGDGTTVYRGAVSLPLPTASDETTDTPPTDAGGGVGPTGEQSSETGTADQSPAPRRRRSGAQGDGIE